MKNNIEKVPERSTETMDGISSLNPEASLKKLTEYLAQKTGNVTEFLQGNFRGKNEEIAKTAQASIVNRWELAQAIMA